MNRDEYLKNLLLLSGASIDNPTAEDMARVCPHLTKNEAATAFARGDGYVACPPVRVRDGFQIVSLSKAYTDDKHVVQPPRLKWSYAGRMRSKNSYRYAKRACAYAKEHWGTELIDDTSESFVTIYLQDPSDLYAEGRQWFPRTKRIIGFTTRRDWSEIANDTSHPQSVTINNALIEVTLDPIVAAELKGLRGGYEASNCAYCGAGLGPGCCTGCDHRFSHSETRSGWYTPLPANLIELVQASGWRFRQDPAVAVAAEREEWLRSQPR